MVRRWCRTFSDGRQQVEDIPRAGWTRTATTDANVGKVDDMIRANRRITIDEVAEELGISHERAQTSSRHSSIQKSVSRWVPRQLTLDTPGTTHGGQGPEHLVRGKISENLGEGALGNNTEVKQAVQRFFICKAYFSWRAF
ncbi:HTH_48 domain-containing protein [Trichonephila inaurata madagascariensis]|uniref:HTH_48 domain-containing protein n=1 Tax=Trichonephila inaurata madagascariensis TaxID=2747483 RepID=A0A8X6XJX8_9ARAC|nr:HTH_48 domain-containing protein [Trichonephila inaurata madagascariensis]